MAVGGRADHPKVGTQVSAERDELEQAIRNAVPYLSIDGRWAIIDALIADGYRKVTLDDATVERAAKAACPWVDWKTSADDVTPAMFQKIRLERNRSKSLIRAVLAAAVKEDG